LENGEVTKNNIVAHPGTTTKRSFPCAEQVPGKAKSRGPVVLVGLGNVEFYNTRD
jgi:hypothetical protein